MEIIKEPNNKTNKTIKEAKNITIDLISTKAIKLEKRQKSYP
jgi:hypothetical protein